MIGGGLLAIPLIIIVSYYFCCGGKDWAIIIKKGCLKSP